MSGNEEKRREERTHCFTLSLSSQFSCLSFALFVSFCHVSADQFLFQLSFTDSLEKQKENPCLSPWLHLWQFQEKHQRLPFPWNRVDADELAQMMTSSEGQDRARLLSYTCQGGLIGLTSLMGGVVAHEAVKAVTRKFTPLSDQWIFHDATDLIDRSSIFESAEYVPRNDQFDSLRICVGQKMCEEMAASRVFVAGAGAIGCEVKKRDGRRGIPGDAKMRGEDGERVIGKKEEKIS